MSLFEDPIEVHSNAEKVITGPREVDTLIEALDLVKTSPDNVAIVLDWDSAYEISNSLDAHVSLPDHVVREHVELSTQRIGKAIGTKATVHGINSGQAFGLLLDPSKVRYDNSISHQGHVVGIDWVDNE